MRRWLAIAPMLMVRGAQACVTCDSQTAHQVRHGIFGSHFGMTLFMVLAPFPLFVAFAGAVYRAFPLPVEPS